jgi:hypothetical protein
MSSTGFRLPCRTVFPGSLAGSHRVSVSGPASAALAGCVVFVAEEQWLLVALMILIEAVFIFAFTRLVAQARARSPRTRPLRNRYPGTPS